MDKYDLTEGVVWKKLLSFFFPILFGMLFQQLYNTVDAVIVGKCLGSDALAAVGGSPAVITNLIIGFFNGLASGAGVIISQLFGAKDYDRLSKTAHAGIAFCLVIGAVLTVVCRWLTPWMLSAVKTPADVMADSVAYLKIYFVGTMPLLIYNIGSGIMRAVGNSRKPLYFLGVCCALNIVLDLTFIRVLGMGVEGAAWATVISVALCAVMMMVSLRVSRGPERFFLRRMNLNTRTLGRVLYMGIPAGVQSAMYSISNLLIQAAVNGLGTDVVSAWSAIGKIDGIYWVTSNAFGIAICAFVGQCFGAGMFDRMKSGVRTAMNMELGIAAALAVVLCLLSKPGLRLIVDNPAVIDLGAEMIMYFAPFYVVWTVIEILSATLRGAGDAVRPTLIVVVGVCVLRVIWVFAVVPHWNTVRGISMAYPVSWVTAAAAMIVYYFKSGWLERCQSRPVDTE